MKFKEVILFSESCYYSEINLNHNKIYNYLKKADYEKVQNPKFNGCYSSLNNQNILNKIEEEQTIINEFNKHIDFAIKNHFNYNIGFKINNIWATKAEPNGMGEYHTHSNFWLSGIYYPNGTLEDKYYIEFERSLLNPFLLNVINYNSFNSDVSKLLVKQGTLLIFPACQRHRIGYNNTNQDRYSIAFNVLPIGQTGSRDGFYNFE